MEMSMCVVAALRLLVPLNTFSKDAVISPVECVALSRPHGSENLHLLLPQVLEAGLHQSHLLTPHLGTDGRLIRSNAKP